MSTACTNWPQGLARRVIGVYLGCVAVATRVLPFHGGAGIAVSVLVAVALFNPLRRRVQGAVDRRFNRAHYSASQVVAQFAVRLREEMDLDVMGSDLLGVIDQVLAPEHLGLWLSAGGPDTAVHGDDGAGDIRTAAAGQEHGDAGHVVGPADAA